MAYSDYQQFLARLEQEGELKRITHPLDPYLEITEVADRAMKSDGPALLIENPVGSQYPLCINAFGSRRRMSMALGVDDFEEIAAEIDDLLKPELPEPRPGLLGKALSIPQVLPQLGKLFNVAKSLPPELLTSAISQEVVKTGDQIDLFEFPHLHCWPLDGGRYITLPLVFTHDPNTGKRNVGMYRIQVLEKAKTAMHWQAHKVGAEHYRRAEERNQPIHVAVALGGDPALTFAAVAPLPPAIDELMFAGFVRKKPVQMVKAKTVDLMVPADAEIVIEGIVNPGERCTEGPFGDHTGYYSLADEYPVFHITAVTHRAKPVYPATIVGIPPMEDGWIGKAVERIFLPLVKTTMPEIIDMHLPVHGCFHNVCLVSIKKRYPGHAFKVMHGLWGLGQLMFSKFIFVFDEDVNVQDLNEAIWRLGANVDPARDSCIVKGPVDVLDHTSPIMGLGGKLGLDATHKWPGEGFQREWPDVITMSPEVKSRIDSIWDRLGL
ncbi:MAG: menaquinone biosynthesis decarboxylase [Armatimonadetes bacterium]|nr:menaquinone biosynthesis decarboxylase [Armatimonadota bacterium]